MASSRSPSEEDEDLIDSKQEVVTMTMTTTAKKKKLKIDFFGMLTEDGLLNNIVRFVGDATSLARLTRMNKRFRNIVQSKELMKVVANDMSITNGHTRLEWDEEYTNLEAMAFYQAVVKERLFEKKRVITNDRYSKQRIPHSALRANRMMEILNHFPQCKTIWESRIRSPQYYGGIVGAILNLMIDEGVIPSPFHVDVAEHVNINAYPGRKKYNHVLYQEYRREVASNLFQFSTSVEIAMQWDRVPLQLQLLVASGNQQIKW